MFLLYFLIALFLVVLGLIVYANWPSSDSSGCGGCPTPPCNRCGVPKQNCRCRPKPDGCQFC